MQIAHKGLQGVRLLLALARHGQSPMPVSEVGVGQEIGAKYIEQLLARLKAAGLVKSVRGAKGGYLLARPADQITLLDIVTAMEGPLATPATDDRVLLRVWERLGDSLAAHLEGFTLARIMGMQDQEAE